MRNLTMLMDYYELTMANGYYVTGNKDKIAVFDMFYRTNPDGTISLILPETKEIEDKRTTAKKQRCANGTEKT